MKIDSSAVGMESARSYKTTWKASQRFMITDYQNSRREFGSGVNLKGKGEEKNQVANLSDHQRSMSVGRTHIRVRERNSTMDNLRQMTVRRIFELLFAQRRSRFQQWMEDRQFQSDMGFQDNGMSFDFSFSVQNQLGIGRETYYEESEYTSFSTQGIVKTSDGRTIEFGINLEMSNSFQEYFREDLAQTAVQLCDPIVLNFDTDVAKLSDQTFYFDLDMDGEQDEISSLAAGSGFLALDLNGNGKVDDGSELFGTSSQNGFADLAKYDLDHNGWIDENDAVFDKLKIWCKDENGEDVLYSLKDKGVGAICLQNVSTDFSLNNSAGQYGGQLRRTGVFLFENGNAGTIQHVDLAKFEKNA